MLRPARYLDEVEVEFGELHIFVGPDFVVTIRHAETQNLARTRIRVQKQPKLLRCGPEAVLCAAIVDRLTFQGTIIETGTDSYRLAHTRAVQTE